MISLYIHIPFCGRKCFYCSFAVAVGQTSRADVYLDCLEREARQYQGAEVQTVYIGGGTPTLMTDCQLQRLLDIIRESFCFSPEVEWTVEANPEGLDNSKLALLKREGVNRISLGIQSLNDKYLNYLGRNHNAATAREAFRRVEETGFDNVNVDMMFSFPEQTTEELKEDMAAVTCLGSDHVSLYSLTVEEQSRFYVKDVRLRDDQCQARHYTLMCGALEAEGFRQYEVSNFAKPGKESRHNLNYWQGGHYIGLGVGAHSHIGTKRFWNTSRLNNYISGVQKGIPVREGCEELTPHDKAKEIVLFGLRMNCGVDVERLQKQFGRFLNDEQLAKIDRFVQGNFLVRENGRLKASSKGRLVLDELCALLI